MNGLRAALAIYALLMIGCTISRPAKGGASRVEVGKDSASLNQPENPATESRQTVTKTTTRKFSAAPAAGRNRSVRAPQVGTPQPPSQPSPQPQPSPESTIEPTAAAPVEEVTETTVVETVIGPAHKDTSSELRAKIESMRPMQIVGAGMIVAACAMFYPPIRKLGAFSREMQATTAAAGFALVYGPQIIAGNEWLIILGVVAYYVISRHSYTKGKADAASDGPTPPPSS